MVIHSSNCFIWSDPKKNHEARQKVFLSWVHNNKNDPTFLLQVAAERGYLEAVKCLVEQEADVTVKDENGQTPLDKARDYQYQDIVEYLEPLMGKGENE